MAMNGSALNIIDKKRVGCYYDTYLRAGVLLLADLFETFRNACLEHYRLDSKYFSIALGLAWHILLKTTSETCEHKSDRKNCQQCLNGFRLELFKNIDMLLMFEKEF